MTKTIFIVRHGQTDYNKLHIVQGSGVNSDLNEKGRLQAAAFYQQYQAENFEVVLTSTLIRTHQTMAPFIQAGLPWEQFSEIDEMSWGVHEGKSSSLEMRAEYKSMIEQWNKGNYDIGLEGGETAAELARRINLFIEQLRIRKERKILVCSHGRAMRCLMTLLKGDHLYNMESYNHSNTGLYKVLYSGSQFVFELENDTAHFRHMEHNYDGENNKG